MRSSEHASRPSNTGRSTRSTAILTGPIRATATWRPRRDRFQSRMMLLGALTGPAHDRLISSPLSDVAVMASDRSHMPVLLDLPQGNWSAYPSGIPRSADWTGATWPVRALRPTVHAPPLGKRGCSYPSRCIDFPHGPLGIPRPSPRREGDRLGKLSEQAWKHTVSVPISWHGGQPSE